MCRVLKISRSSYYYKPVKKENTDILEQTIKKIFKDSRNNYGSRKIKFELSKEQSPYKPEFVKKIEQGDKDLKNGKGRKVSIEELDNLWK